MVYYLKHNKCQAGCPSSSVHTLFRFPHCESRYQQWADIAGIPFQKGEKMKKFFLCERHFHSNQFRDGTHSTLIYGATPTITKRQLDSGSLPDSAYPSFEAGNSSGVSEGHIPTCAMRGCVSNDLKPFSFPQTVYLAEKWRKCCGNPKLYDVPVEKLFSQFVVCRKHFARHQFNSDMENLKPNTVPTLFLPPLDSSDLNHSTPPDISKNCSTPLQSIVELDVTIPQTDVMSSEGLVVDSDPGKRSDGVCPSSEILNAKVIAVGNDLENLSGQTSIPISYLGTKDLPVVGGTEKSSTETFCQSNAVNTNGLHIAEVSQDYISDCDYGNDESSDASPMLLSNNPPNPHVLLGGKAWDISYLKSSETKKTVAPLNDYYRYNICRLCFCQSDSLINIFEAEQRCRIKICDAIEDLLQIKVSKADDYPQFICTECVLKLKEFKDFKDCLIKLKEEFEKALLELRRKKGVDEDQEDVAPSQHDPPLCEDMGNSKDVDHLKPLSGSEVVADEDLLTRCSEDCSESEQGMVDFEDDAVDDLADAETMNDIDPDLKDIVIQEEYKCNECGEVFKFKNLLTKHHKEHQKTWPLPCQYCDKRFKTLLGLNNHISMHSNYKPYECEHCGLRCRMKSTLAQHKKIHSEDKPFLCSMCGLTFRSRNHLARHLRMHSGIKCYKCEECGNEFRSSYKLSMHYTRHHIKERPYVCGDCGKSFRDMVALRRHVTNVHQTEKHFQCEVCGKHFSVRNYLNSHMKIHFKHK